MYIHMYICIYTYMYVLYIYIYICVFTNNMKLFTFSLNQVEPVGARGASCMTL